MVRRLITLGLVVFVLGLWLFYSQGDSTSQAELAPQQVQNDSRAIQEELAPDYTVPQVATGAALLVMAALWILPSLAPRSKRKNDFLAVGLVGALLLPVLAACGPAQKEVIINIEPNETAFVVPLVGDGSEQLQFQSVEFLAERQVAAKQIIVPQRKRVTGRGPGSYEWIPTVAVIIVDRTPVTREWTSASNTGTSSNNQAFGVESNESIDFRVGATCSAIVEESNAAKFLYYFSGRSLAAVMDENVRGYLQSELFREFGQRTLQEGQREKSEIFSLAFSNVKSYFAEFGITVTSCGGSEGMMYNDQRIQDEINQNFAIQQEVERASARATAQSIENEITISQANTYATATVVAGLAQASVLEETGQQLAQNPAVIQYEMAQRSTGQVPGILIISNDQVDQLPFSFFLSPDEWAEYGVDVTPAP